MRWRDPQRSRSLGELDFKDVQLVEVGIPTHPPSIVAGRHLVFWHERELLAIDSEHFRKGLVPNKYKEYADVRVELDNETPPSLIFAPPFVLAVGSGVIERFHLRGLEDKAAEREVIVRDSRIKLSGEPSMHLTEDGATTLALPLSRWATTLSFDRHHDPIGGEDSTLRWISESPDAFFHGPVLFDGRWLFVSHSGGVVEVGASLPSGPSVADADSDADPEPLLQEQGGRVSPPCLVGDTLFCTFQLGTDQTGLVRLDLSERTIDYTGEPPVTFRKETPPLVVGQRGVICPVRGGGSVLFLPPKGEAVELDFATAEGVEFNDQYAVQTSRGVVVAGASKQTGDLLILHARIDLTNRRMVGEVIARVASAGAHDVQAIVGIPPSATRHPALVIQLRDRLVFAYLV